MTDDTIHLRKTGGCALFCYGECCKGYMGIVNPDGFCYRGERIDDE